MKVLLVGLCGHMGQNVINTMNKFTKDELKDIVKKYKGHLIATSACIGGELSSNALLNLPIEEILLQKGRNIIPTIHMKDLITIISKVIEKKPNSYYLLALFL